MLTPTSTDKLHKAIFRPCGTPDFARLRELVDGKELDYTGVRLALSIIRGETRARRKERNAARYLRHYRRIAASLS